MTEDADELKRAVEERLGAVERDIAGFKDHVRESAPMRTYEAARHGTHLVGRITAWMRTAWNRRAVAVVGVAAAVGVAIALRRRSA